MKSLYIECAMGAAGDMLTAALLELHPDPAGFVERLNACGIPSVSVFAEESVKCGIKGLHMTVRINGEEEGEEHHHGHHHHHHADEVFTSWGVETSNKFTVDQIRKALASLDTQTYGMVLRAKGMIAGADGKWIHFDYVPEEINIRFGCAAVIGKICVIGSNLDEDAIQSLFGV